MIDYSKIELEKSSHPAGGRPRYLINGKEMSAVEAVINHYSLKGDRAIWAENNYWWTLMTLVFWDAIFAPVEGAVRVTIKGVEVDLKPTDKNFPKLFEKTIAETGAPADFLTDAFYERRKKIIDDIIKELRNRNMERKLLTTFNENIGVFVATVENWARYPSQTLSVAINRMESEKLLGIMERLITNFKENRYGLPDLLVYNDSEVYFAEILDEGESLTPEQKGWHDFLAKDMGVRVEVLLVNRSEDDILQIENAFTAVEHTVTISFAHSPEKLSTRELDLVRAQESYFSQDNGIERRHGAAFPVNEEKIPIIFELLDLTYAWESQHIEFDGEVISSSQLRDSLRCYLYKAKQGASLDYCRTGEFSKKPNIFGCRSFNFIEIEESFWNEFGKIIPESGDWVFDKRAIREQTEKEKYRLSRCPLFNAEKIDAVIEAYPDKINPRVDQDWAYMDLNNGLWFWHESRWLSVYGKTKMPPIAEMAGVKKLTNAEKNQAIQYLKDQSTKQKSGSAKPIKAKNQKPCFIATAVYGGSDYAEVESLRGYRDEVLNNTFTGRIFIRSYYIISPWIARLINRYPRTRRPLKYLLDSIVCRLDNKYNNL